MSNLAVLSLKNRALIALITICAAIFGGLSLTNLKQELIPSIELPALMVTTTYPGASPDVVEEDISTPIEEALQAVDGIDSSSATSSTNASMVQAMFDYGTNMATAEQDVQRAINGIADTLPEDVDPRVLAISIDDLPVVQVAISGYDDGGTIQDRLDTIVIPEIEDVDGVASASLVGATGERITITPDADELASSGYSQQAITDALQQNGSLFPGGEITQDGETLTVQTGDRLTSVDAIRALPLVGQPQTDPLTGEQTAPDARTIGEVADVALENDPVSSISRVNGEDAISISITKLPDGNTVDVSDGVTAALDDVISQIPGAEYTVVFDQAPFITDSIDTLAVEGLLGLVFAVLVILVFLLSIRSTLVTAISIPTSVLISFASMQAFGYSLNMLTLGALTISIGRVVDDSIVVIENIKRHYVQGADKGAAIRLAVKEVAGAITASTITTVAVFLPIAFVGDMVGELFRPFAMTVTIAMLASLLVALTIVPVLAYWFMKPGKPLLDEYGRAIDPEHPNAPLSRLQKAYAPILRWTLRHSWSTLGLAALVMIGTVALAPMMKISFLGDSGQNTLTVSQEVGDAASLDEQDAAAQQVEEKLQTVDGVDDVQVSIGSGGSPLMGGGGITFSVMTDPDADQEQLRDDVQTALDELGDDAGELTVAASAGMGSSDITVEVSAGTSDEVRQATETLVAEIDGKDGIGEVTHNLQAALPFIQVQVDREAAAERGLSEAGVGNLVDQAMQPQQAGTIELDDRSVTIYLASDEPPMTISELQDLDVPTASGVIALDEIAEVTESSSPASITTVEGRLTATITVPPSSDDLTVATASVQQAIDAAELPEGASADIGGVATEQQDSFTQLGIAMLAAILIIYVVMVATFKSLRQPLLLLVSVPFAATGAIILQVVTGVPLGVASLIGVLMLIGIVVTNAIVLVDLVNQYRDRHGLSAHDATLAGSSMRLRPILMTALATIFALTPMALGITGHGGFISQPLAIVVIGGLVSSTFLTLIVLPTLYNLVEGARERRRARRGDGPDGGAGQDPDAPSGGPGGHGIAQADGRAEPAEPADAQIPVLAGSDSAAESDAAGGEAHASRPGTDIERTVTGTVVTPTEPMTRAQQHGQTVVDVHRPGAVPGETPIVTVTVQHPDDQESAHALPAASPVQTRRSRNQH
ncbi:MULTISPECIES: efflux RND transporter permease subunit [unclassified Microbacterium]|uniref:efflux RND transporter permease subunit n=1 Tax=unclassified Microbacterium TaxID=2609290 RepID=UPI00097EE94C|nr:efflux RND transporter permease subunit [Microbacterium sp. JB110]RCS60198.1 AcrB/AcrD/AcrF family protein [Microbacterium sp. JB110]SJM48275.1 RND multidrug efflux transporter; Acriflavin resistance protein [Frigoribacterium sp. JB110]